MVKRVKKPTAAAVLFAAFLWWLPGPALAVPGQETAAATSSDTTHLDGRYVKKFGLDFGSVYTSPARWNGGQWLTFAAVVGAGAVIFAFDRDIYEAVQKQKTDFSRGASPYIRVFGDGGFLIGLTAALYASGEIFAAPGLRKTALLGLESFLTTEALVLALKVAVGRARPYIGESSHNFHPFTFRTGYTSFPSGDASGAFSVATVIAERTDSVFVDVLVYGLAGLVALYRVHDQFHWPSDVLLGSALGFVVGKKVCRLNDDRSANQFHVAFECTGTRQAVTIFLVF
jgi:membrane-associated phospholipid phosphatase